MTTLYGKNRKVIQFSLSNVIHECSRDMCIIEMPMVICNNRKDAEYIQKEIGEFIGALSEQLLKE